MIACLLVGAMSTTAFAAKSQTEIHIHHVGDVREGNGEIKNNPPVDDGEPTITPMIPFVPVIYVPEQVEEIPEEESPLVELPEEEAPLIELPEEEVPLVEIPEEDVPQAEVPRTGDTFLVWVLLAFVPLAAMTLMLVKPRKEN